MRNTNKRTVSLGSIYMEWLLYNSRPKFQRRAGLWKKDRKQIFIDSLLNTFDCPKIYCEAYNGVDDLGFKYGIVDGQQRLTTLIQFFRGEFKLSSTFLFTPAGYCNLEEKDYPKAGDTYVKFSEPLKQYFKNMAVDIVYLEHWPKPLVREQFRRLNSHTPLVSPEYNNSYDNPVNTAAKEIAEHPYFKEKVSFKDSRFDFYDIALKLLVLEYKYVVERQDFALLESRSFINLFLEREDLIQDDKLNIVKSNLIKRLTILHTMFEDKDPILKSKATTVVFCMLTQKILKEYASPICEISDLIRDTLRRFEEERIKDLYEQKVSSFTTYKHLSYSGVFSKKNVLGRVDILTKYLLMWHGDKIKPKDPRRAYNEKERLFLYYKDEQTCQICNKKISFDEMDADHIERHTDGGPTTLDNARCLCYTCNRSTRKAAA